MVEDVTERFAALVARQDQPLPVDEALLLIAAHADPTIDIGAQQGRLDELAAQVEEPTIEALRHLLFDRLGFAGDRATYYAAENSLLPRVLDRRLGIPLSLSLLTIEVGRRCGVAVEGIGMPGHYLVRPAGETERFLDVYDGGRVLDVEGCHAALRAGAGRGAVGREAPAARRALGSRRPHPRQPGRRLPPSG